MRLALLSLSLIAACAEEPEACTSGFTRGDDGNCYEDATGDGGSEDGGAEGDGGSDAGGDATFESVLDALPDCEPGATDGELDLSGGCAGGACVDMTYDELAAALGEADECLAIYFNFYGFESSQVRCEWAAGISTYFDDLDLDGTADDDAQAWPIYVDLPWDGGTTDGLGPWASMSCFVDVYGYPDAATAELDDDGEYAVTYMSFDTFSIYDDLQNKDLGYAPDGLVDSMSLYGAW